MSFGLTFDKLIIIAVIAVFLIGPDRLPGYAAQLAKVVRSLRSMADGAKDRMREEMGPEFDEVDWKKLDPRQYDPRRIIREALLEDPMPTATEVDESAGESAAMTGEGAGAAGAEGAGADGAGAEGAEKPTSAHIASPRYVETAYERRQRSLGKGRPAPYDVEAT